MSHKYDFYFATGQIPGSARRIAVLNDLIYARLTPWIKRDSSVLELGTGKAFFARTCAGRGHAYLGVEANQSQCRQLEQEGFGMVCGRVPPIPVSGKRFDLIYNAHLMEHLSGSDMVYQLLADCHRLLETGGVLATLVPDAEAMGMEFWNCDYTHTYLTTERRLTQALADAGFRLLASNRFNGHYTGVRRQLARAGSSRFTMKGIRALTRSGKRRDLAYRGWMYLQQTLLLVATPAD